MRRRFLDFVGMSVPGPVADDFFRLFTEHPGVCVPDTQTRYFSSVTELSKGREWYEAQFNNCASGLSRGECSTSYLTVPGVAPRLAREYPDAKLFALIVDPLEAVAALYEQSVPVAARATSTLELFLEKQPALLEQWKFGRHLAAFFSYYSPVDLFVCTNNELRADPVRVFGQLYRHLGIDPTAWPKVLRVLATEDDDRRPSRWERLLRLPQLRAKRKARQQAAVGRLFPTPTYTLSARERVLLSKYYEEDVAQLSVLLHRDLAAEWHHLKYQLEKKKSAQ